jgi:hypothetical protein
LTLPTSVPKNSFVLPILTAKDFLCALEKKRQLEVFMYRLQVYPPLVEEDRQQIEREGNRAENPGDCPYLDEGPARDAWMKGFHSPRIHESHPHQEFHHDH